MKQKTEEKPKPTVIDGQPVHYFYIRDENRHIVSLVGWHKIVLGSDKHPFDSVVFALATCNPKTVFKMLRRKDLGPHIFEQKKSRDNFTRERAHAVVNKKLRRANVVLVPSATQPISNILITLTKHHRLERVREAAKTTLGWFGDHAKEGWR